MREIIKKHPKVFWGIIIAIIVIFVLAVWQRKQYMDNPYENQIGNPPREATALQDTFYYDQLSDKEKKAYETVKNAIENFEGGVIEFPEAINGKEYARVSMALQCGQEDYFYAIADVPMTQDNQNVKSTTKNILNITDDTIAKCILFLYPAEGIDIQGNIDDDGYVTNLDELKEPLAAMNEEKKNKVLEMKTEAEDKLNAVVDNMPKEYGKKEAIDYFLKWMDENLKIDEEIMQSTEGVTNMSEAFEQIYFKSYCSCLAGEKATTSGFAKVLSYLCNRAGIEAHVVTGNWGSSQAYSMTYVNFDGKPVYIDASGYKKSDLWNQRYISDTFLNKKMDLADYFDYEIKED